jgi:hypothetical protein
LHINKAIALYRFALGVTYFNLPLLVGWLAQFGIWGVLSVASASSSFGFLSVELKVLSQGIFKASLRKARRNHFTTHH